MTFGGGKYDFIQKIKDYVQQNHKTFVISSIIVIIAIVLLYVILWIILIVLLFSFGWDVWKSIFFILMLIPLFLVPFVICIVGLNFLGVFKKIGSLFGNKLETLDKKNFFDCECYENFCNVISECWDKLFNK